MNHKAHMLAGIVSGVSITRFLLNHESKESAFVGGVACFLGSEFPDLDTGSTPSLIAVRIGFLASIVLLYFDQSFYAAVIGAGYMFVKGQPHRGITHSYLLPVIFFLLSSLVFPQYAIMLSCFGIGLIVHYAIDRRNPLNPLNWLPA